MLLNIKTTAQGCHVLVNIKIQGHTILSLTDSDEGNVTLQPNLIYRFEWFVVAGKDHAQARIQALATPATPNFPPLNIAKEYSAGDQDGNVFLFTTN